jgi:acyl-coenzyme A synthetase/AMP-(fatty) acid ligase
LAFIQNPLNNNYPEIIYKTGDVVAKNKYGELIFKGRKDSLIKHHGYRIELSEIEHIYIHNSSEIKNACVIYNNTIKEIILIYECAHEIDVSLLIKIGRRSLPKYMIPNKFINISKMPMNLNGKIDRLSLGVKYGGK